MIHINSISNALYSVINQDSGVASLGAKVDLNEIYNTDINLMPWIGIYTDNAEIEPHRIGSTRPFRASVNFSIYVQADSFKSSNDANDMLDKAVNAVLTVVNSNRTLLSTVHTITNINISPFERNIQDEQWMFVNELTIGYILDV